MKKLIPIVLLAFLISCGSNDNEQISQTGNISGLKNELKNSNLLDLKSRSTVISPKEISGM